MKVQALLGAAVLAAAAFLGAQGCSSVSEANPNAIRCTPGANVFCRCADRGAGTKLCREDGASFEACTTGETGECVGGEDLTDPQTGTPVDPDPGELPPDPVEAGPPGSAIDSCPGQPTSVGSQAVIVNGDTTGAKDKAKGKTGACAAGAGGPDHVYRIQPTASGSLAIKVQGAGALNPTLYLRTTCADEATQAACSETTGPAGIEQFTYNVITGHDYYLFVDGASGSAGKYSLNLKVTPGPFCGDGKIDANEACDDTNHVEGDGCSASCLGIAGDPATGGSCPGQPVHVWPGKTVTGTGSTNPYGNTFTKTGSSCIVSASDLNAAQDHVYAVTTHGAGNLKVTLTPTEGTYNAMLVARKTCADPNSQLTGMCANDQSAGVAEVMTFAVTNNQTVYVAAEGVLNAKGSYTIKFELP